MSTVTTRTHDRARWTRPRAYSTSLASPRRRPSFVILRSSCGHMLGVGLVWRRQRYLAWKACR